MDSDLPEYIGLPSLWGRNQAFCFVSSSISCNKSWEKSCMECLIFLNLWDPLSPDIHTWLEKHGFDNEVSYSKIQGNVIPGLSVFSLKRGNISFFFSVSFIKSTLIWVPPAAVDTYLRRKCVSGESSSVGQYPSNHKKGNSPASMGKTMWNPFPQHFGIWHSR